MSADRLLGLLENGERRRGDGGGKRGRGGRRRRGGSGGDGKGVVMKYPELLPNTMRQTNYIHDKYLVTIVIISK